MNAGLAITGRVTVVVALDLAAGPPPPGTLAGGFGALAGVLTACACHRSCTSLNTSRPRPRSRGSVPHLSWACAPAGSSIPELPCAGADDQEGDGAVLESAVCPPELKVRAPAHAKQLGWHVEFESRVTQALKLAKVGDPPQDVAYSTFATEHDAASEQLQAYHDMSLAAGEQELVVLLGGEHGAEVELRVSTALSADPAGEKRPTIHYKSSCNSVPSSR